MIAALPMYDRPALRENWSAFWEACWTTARQYGCKSWPSALTWDTDHRRYWTAGDLFLGQTCSLPYRQALHPRVTPIGSFDFDLPGCPPGYYNSVIVTRVGTDPGDLAAWPTLRLAINDYDSQSGWAALWSHLQSHDLRPTGSVLTGSHAASIDAVRSGRADIAAIDAQSFRLLAQESAFPADLQELARTAPSPGLPLITAVPSAAERIAQVLGDVIVEPANAEAIAPLGLRQVIRFSSDDYLSLPVPPEPSEILAL